MQACIFGNDLLFNADRSQVPYDVFRLYSLKVEYLATGKNGRQYFMFFGSSEDKYGIGGGSSSVFRKALKAAVLSMCTSSII